MGEPRLMPGQCRPYQVYPSLSDSKNHMIKKTKEEPLRLTEYHRILSRTRFVQWKTCPLWFCSSGEWGRWFCSVCFSKSLPVWRPTSDGCGTASSSGLSAAASSPGMLRPLLKLSTHSLGPQKMINRKHIHTNPKKGWTYSNVELSHKKYTKVCFQVVVMFSKTLPGCPVAGVAVTSAWPSWPSPGDAWGSHPTLLYSTQTWMTGGVHYKMLCTRFYSSLPMGEPRLMPGQCRPYQVYPSLSDSKNHMIKKLKRRTTKTHRISQNPEQNPFCPMKDLSTLIL